jgi:CHAT domain-containing protein
MSLSNFANLLRETGDYTGARPLYERAIAIGEKTHDPIVPHSLRHLGELLQYTGDYAGARPLYERALVIWEKAFGPDHPRAAEALNHLANLLRDTGDYAGAKPLYERTLVIREKALGSDHPEVVETLNNFAQLLAEIGDSGGALQAALRAEQIGRDHLGLTARGLAEREALRYAAVRATGLDLALLLIAEVGNEFPEARQQVWDAVIRSRALILDEMAGRHRTVAEAAQITQLAQALTSAYQRLANLTVRGPGNQLPEQYRKLLDEARQEKEQAERALAKKSTTFQQEQTRNQIGFAEVAAALSSGSALVAFAHYDHYEAANKKPTSPVSSYLAFVLRGGEKEPIVVPLGTAKEIEALVARWSDEAAKGVMISGRSLKQTEAAYRKAGEALRQKIWDPVAKHLQDVKNIFVVPDGALNLVNFAALPSGQSDYVVEAGPLIHYLSAERDLVPFEAPGIKGEGLLALGGPAFDETTLFAAVDSKDQKSAESGKALAMASRYRGERSNCGDFQSMRFEPLPASEHEVKEIVSLWTRGSGTATAVDLTGVAASEAAFKEQASGRRVLHLATHGFFLAGRCPSALASARGVGGVKAVAQDEPPPVTGDNPLLLSGLALAGANHRAKAGPEEDDGILTAEEIAAMNLSGVEWAVLSACETGVGKVEAGEGVFGLRRAFQMAGAGTLIMSLWSVEDESARQWMRALYESRLVKKLSTAESVRAASLEVLRSRREKGQGTHPFFWAGFVAAGDWR